MNMTKDDEGRFHDLLDLLAVAAGQARASGAQRRLWLVVLREHPIMSIQAAIGKLLKTRVYTSMPAPAEVVRIIEGLDDLDTVIEAEWSRVLGAIRSVGIYRSLVLDDPYTMQAVIDMGGWQELCRSMTGQTSGIWRANFRRCYESARRGRRAYHGRLGGIHGGEPVYIGDGERCAQIEGGVKCLLN